VSIAVDSVPPGAQVSLDGKVIGKTPYRGTVQRRSGDVALVVRYAGYADRTVMVRGNKAIHESVKLLPAVSKPDRDQSVNPF
jgi:PEGA domain